MAESTGDAGGHTFAVRGSAELNPAACQSCHGGSAETIGTRDWTGNGEERIAAAFERGLNQARTQMSKALRSQRGACGRTADRVVEHDGRIRLATATGSILGDCDDDRIIDTDERWSTSDRLPRATRDAAFDLLLLERDGSRGRHHPSYTFQVLDALHRALEP